MAVDATSVPRASQVTGGVESIRCASVSLDGAQTDNEVRNAISLLAGSVDYGAPGQTYVYHQANKAGWRWNSDIVSFNEILAGKAGIMFSHLTARSPFALERP